MAKKQLKAGDTVIIHCSQSHESRKSIYENQIGKIKNIWSLKRNHWGNYVVELPNGCSNTFYRKELEYYG
jgi:hypothetical protein